MLHCWKYTCTSSHFSKAQVRKTISSKLSICSINTTMNSLLNSLQSFLWTCFVNVRGLPGHNILGDLHQQHLNRLCKDVIHNPGVNKTEKAIVRIGKAMGTISPVLDQFDIQNQVPENMGSHRVPSSEKDRDTIVHQLRESAIFLKTTTRAHHTFPKPRNVLHAMDHRELTQWIADHVAK